MELRPDFYHKVISPQQEKQEHNLGEDHVMSVQHTYYTEHNPHHVCVSHCQQSDQLFSRECA